MPGAVTTLLATKVLGTSIGIWVAKITLSMVVSAELPKKPKAGK